MAKAMKTMRKATTTEGTKAKAMKAKAMKTMKKTTKDEAAKAKAMKAKAMKAKAMKAMKNVQPDVQQTLQTMKDASTVGDKYLGEKGAVWLCIMASDKSVVV
jgi:hypothetical protein